MRHSLPPRNVIVAPRVTHVRSTLLQTSLNSMRVHGYYDRWESAIDPRYRSVILEAIAPVWLPVDVGLAHYAACDTLGLDDTTLEAIGCSSGERLQGTLLAVAAKIAREAGLTGALAAQCFAKLWPRVCQGGGFEVLEVGPKDLTIQLNSSVLCHSHYFRGTFVGNVRAAIRLMSARVSYVKPLAYEASIDRFSVRISYV